MRKLDKTIQGYIANSLNAAAKKHGPEQVRLAATRWCNQQKELATLKRQRDEAQVELDRLNSKLKKGS